MDGPEGRPRVLGTTPSPESDGVPLPAGDDWWVRPRRGVFRDSDWRLLAREIEERGIPGLETKGAEITPLEAIAFLAVTRLRRLDLRVARRPGFALACFRNCGDLRTLILESAPRNDRGEPLLHRFPRLRRLVMPATGEDLQELAPLLELEHLDLTPSPPDRGLLGRLPPLPVLRELRLDGSRVDDGDLAALRVLPALKVLGLSHCRDITGKGLAHLAALPRLRVLEMEVWDGWFTCGTCGRRVVRWKGTPWTRLKDGALKELARIPTLERVVLRGQPFSAKAVAALRLALPRCTVLWEAP